MHLKVYFLLCTSHILMLKAMGSWLLLRFWEAWIQNISVITKNPRTVLF